MAESKVYNIEEAQAYITSTNSNNDKSDTYITSIKNKDDTVNKV